ncbi:LytTR family DNA-binding domain-containing protein [Aquimarina sp. 2201CG5-10]|uniref:LytR/AlgR family response regulator transcription factor n=1 Tax=Aquimarina callyspongiae TaxID=3098150 RepID=UPI002AB41DFB|nr:LytTR family DNA-binding domain-containing protein [Aquimarina sp. 2201CG5-10]MDY8134301.1 LytTR family DNA-binding domain-containing protein [Aquimarina sp. 2201CG5-10]
MNTTLKSIIIDDEKLARNSLRLLLKAYCPQVEIIGEGGDRSSIRKLFKELEPDIVFLDIQLGNTTIFDIIPDIEDINFKIIFISAHEDYALKGYKYDAIDYLLKPVDPIKLKEAVLKAEQYINKEKASKDTVQENLKTLYALRESQQIVLSDSRGLHVIKINDIMYCIAEGNYTSIILNGQPQMVVSKNLKFFEEKLTQSNFFRIHKSNLINTHYLKLLSNDDGGHIVMSDGKSLSISRDKKRELLNRI